MRSNIHSIQSSSWCQKNVETRPITVPNAIAQSAAEPPPCTWPRLACIDNLRGRGQTRQPSFNRWARGTFEQAMLSLIVNLEGQSKARVLPRSLMFQAHRAMQECMRPASLHNHGSGKLDAPRTLQTLAPEGWEPLATTLLGLELPYGSRPAAAHRHPFEPTAGMKWSGTPGCIRIHAATKALFSLVN